MKRVLTAAIALMTVVAVAAAPSVKRGSPQIDRVALSAVNQPLPQLSWLSRIVVPPSLSAPIPTPVFPPLVSATSVGGTIKNVYNSVEPWVRYGFELAAYAVGWIPWVGWLSPQILIFYNFGERIARSITFNVADWLDGQVSFGQGLVNVAVDTVNSLVQLGRDQLNFWLPPLPPLPLSATATVAPTRTDKPSALASRVSRGPAAGGASEASKTAQVSETGLRGPRYRELSRHVVHHPINSAVSPRGRKK